MGLLQKLKSALGLGASGSPTTGSSTPQDVDVTVEREPSTESEDAVKGTETDTSDEPHDEEPAAETATDEADTTDDVTDEAADVIEEAEDGGEADSDETAAPDTNAPVTEIKGVGPAYAERLENAGVSTVAELATADADELAESTDLSPNRISGWIEQAKSF